MGYINRGDLVIKSNQGQIVVGDKVFEIPNYVLKSGSSFSNTMIGDKIYINGYEFNSTNGSWKKTLKATWHKYF